jgi:hypothetical protein
MCQFHSPGATRRQPTTLLVPRSLSAFQVLWTELNRNLCQTRHLAESRMFRV